MEPSPSIATRPPDSALASAAKAGTVGYLAAKIGEAIGQAWIAPGLVDALAGANADTLASIVATVPLVTGALALGLISFAGTAARDIAFAAGTRWAKLVGRLAPALLAWLVLGCATTVQVRQTADGCEIAGEVNTGTEINCSRDGAAVSRRSVSDTTGGILSSALRAVLGGAVPLP